MNENMQKAIEFFNKEDFPAALEIFEEFLKEDPKNAGILNNIATSYFKMGELNKAIAYYERGILADPKVKQLYKNLSDVYIQKGDVLTAIAILQDAVGFMPEETYLRHALVQLYISDCKLDIAIDEIDAILEIDENDLAARYELARVYYELGAYESATDNYEIILSQIVDNPDLYFHTGCAYEAEGNIDKAISNFLKAVNVNEAYYPAYKKLALCFMARGENEDAIEYFEDYLQFDLSDEEKEDINKVIARLK